MESPVNGLHGLTRASGLASDEADELKELVNVYKRMRTRNETLDAYYEGDVMVRDIGVPILPDDAEVHVDLSCDWARKAVTSLSRLVKFDGYVFDGAPDEYDEGLRMVERRCNLRSLFARYKLGVLKKGCAFVTVNNQGTSANVRFHSADSGAAIMDLATDRLRSGFVIADTRKTHWSPENQVVTQANFYMVGKRIMLMRDSPSEWHAERVETPDGAMMMVALVNEPTDTKPLGTSRIGRPVRDLIDDVLRVRLALTISTAFYAIPMRALLGLTDELFKALAEKPKWSTFINPMILTTAGRGGQVPTPYQFPANSPDALIRLIENDAKMFSGATGVPLNSLGIVQDNPSSAEAIAEARKDLTDTAQDLIDGQLVPAMREVATLVMMVESNRRSVDELDEFQLSVMPHFRNPAMPSIAATADAATKLASVNPAFAQTDEFLRMFGFDNATIARISRQMRTNQARQSFGSLLQSSVTAMPAVATQTATQPIDALARPAEERDADIAL